MIHHDVTMACARVLRLRGRKKSFNFTGQRRLPLPVQLGCIEQADQRGNITMCFLANLNMEPWLESPVEIDPTVPYMPAVNYFETDTCAQRSLYPEWTIADLAYSSGPALANGTTAASTLSLGLTSVSTRETLICVVAVDEMAIDRTLSDPWVSCGASSRLASNSSGTSSSTTILFNREYNLLAVNQSWQCSDDTTNTSYSAAGFLDVPFNCSAKTGPSSYACSLPTTNLTGYTYDDLPHMPHTYYTHSCTINSLNTTP